MAERYLYVPIIGLCCTISYSFLNRKLSYPIVVVFGVILLCFQIGVIHRNRIWRNDATLWFNTFQREPKSARACGNLGNAYFNNLRYEEAIKMYRQALCPGTQLSIYPF
ncbi:tetratricopeptide repeat protein [Candidatus Kuenenia stuttgartensis]|uniref:tetratricopeptide repeat protein n=1 Tax=Kuenenia stuttgartiensis TaxID=174633 RepID=UPI003B968F4F